MTKEDIIKIPKQNLEQFLTNLTEEELLKLKKEIEEYLEPLTMGDISSKEASQYIQTSLIIGKIIRQRKEKNNLDKLDMTLVNIANKNRKR